LGFTKDFKPKFLRQYMQLYSGMVDAARQYAEDVKGGSFPNENEQY